MAFCSGVSRRAPPRITVKQRQHMRVYKRVTVEASPSTWRRLGAANRDETSPPTDDEGHDVEMLLAKLGAIQPTLVGSEEVAAREHTHDDAWLLACHYR